MKKQEPTIKLDLFETLKTGLANLDPVYWAEQNLTLDGQPFRVNGNGYKPLADIYRYIGLTALEKNSLPCVVLKARQIGLSTLAAVIELYFMASGLFGTHGRPPMRVLHAFPQLEQSYKYTKTKLNAMISSAKLSTNIGKKLSIVQAALDNASGANDSLQFKQFKHGNHIFIDSIGFDGQRLRGMTIDTILVDEFQHCRGRALSNVLKSLSKAQYGRTGDGVQLYFGTPLQSGSEFSRMWNNSTQQYFHLGCESCGKYFPLYSPNSDSWEQVWIEDDLAENHLSHGFMVVCAHCNRIQDKRPAAERGKWVAMNPGASFIGFHINQLYMPHFSRDKIMREKPGVHPVNTEKTYRNEVLGEFYSGDSSPITIEELDEKCADHGRKFATKIFPSDEKKIYLGCDWGQKIDLEQNSEDTKSTGGQSYSCLVVLQTEGPHILSVQYATRLKRNDLEFKKQAIDEVFRRFSVNQACGDLGYANDLTEILQKEYGDRFLAAQATSKVNGYTKLKTDYFPHTIMYERDYYIAELYDLLKAGRIRFPYGDIEKIGFMLHEICNGNEIKPVMDRYGDVGTRYAKVGTNDSFFALLHAYLAFKMDLTQGFSIHNPNNFQKVAGPKKIPAVLGYLPRFNALKR
jgi:hypothetical protein